MKRIKVNITDKITITLLMINNSLSAGYKLQRQEIYTNTVLLKI